MKTKNAVTEKTAQRTSDGEPIFCLSAYLSFNNYSASSLTARSCPNGLKYGPCPPARDFGSRASGLVFPPRSSKETEKIQTNLGPLNLMPSFLEKVDSSIFGY